jgi:hypothetical protein
MDGQTSKAAPGGRGDGAIPAQIRSRMISVAAYYRAEHRGFCCGDELSDWLDAEAEIEPRLQQHGGYPEPDTKQVFLQRLEAQLMD